MPLNFGRNWAEIQITEAIVLSWSAQLCCRLANAYEKTAAWRARGEIWTVSYLHMYAGFPVVKIEKYKYKIWGVESSDPLSWSTA